MSPSLYHDRGWWNGMLRPVARHVRELARNPAYRALHRFHRRLRSRRRGERAEVEYRGRVIRLCDAPSFLSAWDEIFVNRIYDVGGIPSGKPMLVDAGANIGLAALYWKIRYGDFDYIGFEPDPEVAACASANLRAWAVDGELLGMAVAGAEGEAGFVSDGADGGRLGEGALRVRTTRLSRFLPKTVDLLKIDVEGAEAVVLDEVAPALGRVRNVFVEWHGRSGEAGFGRAISVLEAAGFDCHVQVAAGTPRPLMRESSVGAPFFQNLNIYGVRP